MREGAVWAFDVLARSPICPNGPCPQAAALLSGPRLDARENT